MKNILGKRMRELALETLQRILKWMMRFILVMTSSKGDRVGKQKETDRFLTVVVMEELTPSQREDVEDILRRHSVQFSKRGNGELVYCIRLIAGRKLSAVRNELVYEIGCITSAIGVKESSYDEFLKGTIVDS